MGKRKDCWSAGHGSGSRDGGKTDSGAVGYGVEAKKARALTLRMAQNSAAMGVPTLFRDTGRYYLADNQAHAFGATRFREIHFDAGPRTAKGCSVLIGPNASDFEKEMAKEYCEVISETLGTTNRGVKVRSDLAVLDQYKDMASFIIEVSFITNKTDMIRYEERKYDLELALVNVDRKFDGAQPMTKLPRTTWRKVRIPRKLTTV